MIKKNNNEKPAVGFGTYPLTGKTCIKAVKEAINNGYRHIDTAAIYNNESEVGTAIKESGVSRSEFFITTKVWYTDLQPKKLKLSAEESLQKLKTDHVNLLLIHWPAPEFNLEDSLDALMELLSQGKAQHIGISNFPPSLFKKACLHAPIFTNQVEYHPYIDQDQLLEICEEHNVLLTAYSPLAKGKVLQEEVLTQIGRKYDKTPSQVTLRWLIQQHRVITIPKAASVEHQKINMDIFDFELSEDEIEKIFTLRSGQRVIQPAWDIDWED
ncbi:aldo/keto reductase [soil metagenome]